MAKLDGAGGHRGDGKRQKPQPAVQPQRHQGAERNKQQDVGAEFNLVVAHQPGGNAGAMQAVNDSGQLSVDCFVHGGGPKEDADQCCKVDKRHYGCQPMAECSHGTQV